MKIDLTKAMDKLLTEYETDIRQTASEQVQAVGTETVKYLKKKSPRSSKGKRHYATGWKDDVDITWHGTSLIIYNKTKPQLTHLLNTGYVRRDGRRIAGDKHIDYAEDYANDLLIQKVEGALKQ